MQVGLTQGKQRHIMPLNDTGHRVSEHDLHIAVGAFDEVHHPHGYRHVRERHHWYWFAGIAATVAAALFGALIYWQVHTLSPPVCGHDGELITTSPDGRLELAVTRVSCFGAKTELKVFIRPSGASDGHGKAIASFSDAASLHVRWSSDTDVLISHTGGKVWSFQPLWRDVHVTYK